MLRAGHASSLIVAKVLRVGLVIVFSNAPKKDAQLNEVEGRERPSSPDSRDSTYLIWHGVFIFLSIMQG